MRFIVQSNQLTIVFEGMEQIWALKRRIQVPHYAIENIIYESKTPTIQGLLGYWRLPGTSLPFLFMAGTYKRQGRREFWYVKMREPGVMTMCLKPGSLRYDKVRLTCTPELALTVTDWWRSQSAP